MPVDRAGDADPTPAQPKSRHNGRRRKTAAACDILRQERKLQVFSQLFRALAGDRLQEVNALNLIQDAPRHPDVSL